MRLPDDRCACNNRAILRGALPRAFNGAFVQAVNEPGSAPRRASVRGTPPSGSVARCVARFFAVRPAPLKDRCCRTTRPHTRETAASEPPRLFDPAPESDGSGPRKPPAGTDSREKTSAMLAGLGTSAATRLPSADPRTTAPRLQLVMPGTSTRPTR
jgi:hypothetical protein